MYGSSGRLPDDVSGTSHERLEARASINRVPEQARKKVTAPAITRRKGGRRITMVTAYDFTISRLLDPTGIDAL
ncbi:MAG: hypothetical protein AAGA56_12050, partial [Myxococcota bacterium]